jgi:RNA polymerase sigma-70 factor (ECF subfamily)
MENLALIYQAVRTLPPKMREVFILSYREGMTVKQISLHLNMKVKAVKNLKYRTLVTLRSKFRDNHASLLLLALF